MSDVVATLEKTEVPIRHHEPALPPEKQRQIDAILRQAADYLALKIASAWKPDIPEDLRMRLAGARLQQHLVSYILNNLRQREQVINSLETFQGGYIKLVLQPLEKRGMNIKNIDPQTGMFMYLSLMQGVCGVVATWLMAENSGWQPRFASIDDDVRRGIDLVLEKSGRTIFTQVKCHEGSKLVVKSVGSGSPIPFLAVNIPAPVGEGAYFFQDPDLGIPHSSNSKRFGEYVNNQLKGGQ